MIVANHQPQFLPYLGFFHKVAQCDLLVVLDDVQFMQRGHQHRNTIKMQTGTQWITVPVVQERGQLIRDVAIVASNWRRKHWAALRTNYGPSPFYRELAPDLEPILRAGEHTQLLPLDLDLLRWAMEVLSIDVPMTLSSQLEVTGDATQRHIEICRAVGASVYLSGAGGRRYMDTEQFERAGIEVRFQDYTPREYPQMFPEHGFIPNLSVIDALFNCGRGARELMS